MPFFRLASKGAKKLMRTARAGVPRGSKSGTRRGMAAQSKLERKMKKASKEGRRK